VRDFVSASVPSLPMSRCARLTAPSLVYGRSLWFWKKSRF
jgi:hypothetical protein